MTFSIVARDAATGDLGVAVQSKFLAVGAVVPWARAGVGAVATQSFSNVAYGVDGLVLLASGASAQEALDRLVAADVLREERQAGIVDAGGRAATFTGADCMHWAGGRTGEGFAAQGNILAGAAVVDGLADTFLAGGLRFPELLVRCLEAADAAGGDRRGRESAALLVVREGGGYGGYNDRWIDLRVDDHPDPIGELGRLLTLHRLYFDRPTADELLPVDEALAAELRARLGRLGVAPAELRGRARATPAGAEADRAEVAVIGKPRPLPSGWTEAWQAALIEWMSIENLEERAAAAGWIDPRVVAYIREKGGAAG